MNYRASSFVNATDSAGTELEAPIGAAEPVVAGRTRPSTGDAEGDWLCAWCLNRVANERERFAFNGKDEFSFSNPDGVRFDIITFMQTHGCRETGVPTLEYTWFPGYAWCYCQCAECGQHLGWQYSGEHQFAGLIKDRIVRALHVRN